MSQLSCKDNAKKLSNLYQTRIMSSKRLLKDKHSVPSKASVTKRRTSSALEKRLSSIKEKEESNPNVIVESIMNDILTAVLDKIYEKYIEEQTVKFVVDCAHQALIKLIKIHFYQHNNYIRTPELWGPDEHIPPSPPDSWAVVDHVSFHKDKPEEDREFVSISNLKLEMQEKADGIITDSEVDLVSQPSLSLIEDTRAVLNEMIDNLPIVSRETSECDVASELSAFSGVVQGITNYTDYKMKPQLSRLSVGDSTMLKLPKIDLPESGNSRKCPSGSTETFQKLPPIRHHQGDDESNHLPDDAYIVGETRVGVFSTSIGVIGTDAKYKCRAYQQAEEAAKKPPDN